MPQPAPNPWRRWDLLPSWKLRSLLGTSIGPRLKVKELAVPFRREDEVPTQGSCSPGTGSAVPQGNGRPPQTHEFSRRCLKIWCARRVETSRIGAARRTSSTPSSSSSWTTKCRPKEVAAGTGSAVPQGLSHHDHAWPPRCNPPHAPHRVREPDVSFQVLTRCIRVWLPCVNT